MSTLLVQDPGAMARTVSVPPEFFSSLQIAYSRLKGEATVTQEIFRDAGFAAGEALFGHFSDWLADRGDHGPNELSDERFPELFNKFFAELGWGDVRLTTLNDAVMVLDAVEWTEASDNHGTGCPVSTGIFSGFFTRLAEAPISVLEVEADTSDTEAAHCRFLLGSVDVLAYVWEAMERGSSWENAAASA